MTRFERIEKKSQGISPQTLGTRPIQGYHENELNFFFVFLLRFGSSPKLVLFFGPRPTTASS